MSQLSNPTASTYQKDWNQLPATDAFARVTRDGVADFYLVQNHVVFCWDSRFSIGFYMDDFNRKFPKDCYGVPVYLRETDLIECLGEPREYFSTLSTSWEIKSSILRFIPEPAGLLPAVRAYEALVRSGIELNDETICSAATNAYWDYAKRRSKLNSTHKGDLHLLSKKILQVDKAVTKKPTSSYSTLVNHHLELLRNPRLVAARGAYQLGWAEVLWLACPFFGGL